MVDNFSLSNSSSSAGTMMNDSPTHSSGSNGPIVFQVDGGNNGASGNTAPGAASAASGAPTESPSSLADSALGGSTSPDLMQVKSQCSSLSDRDEEIFDGQGEGDDGSAGYYDDR